MKKLTWTVTISVDESWVADGFELTNDNIDDHLTSILPYAHYWEIDNKVIKSPPKAAIRKLQGYTD